MKISPAAIFICLFVLLVPVSRLEAAPLNLYSGAVPVPDQSPEERSRAMPAALAQVVQKLTGLRDFSEFPDLEPALQEARSMAITFYYVQAQTTQSDGSPAEELRLVAAFSQPAVDGMIQAMQLPIWKRERRPLTIWLLIDDGLSRQILPIEFEYTWERLAHVAEVRGMPVLRPQPDLDGNYPVDPQLLWGGYTEDLVASGPADALVFAARREGPEWNVRVNLDYMELKLSWRNRAIDIQDALAEGLDTAIDQISAANSIAAADQGQWRFEITVSGLAAAGDYVRCLSYLQGLSLVDHVRVASADPGRVRFVLSLNAVPDYLVQTLAADRFLEESANEGEYSLVL